VAPGIDEHLELGRLTWDEYAMFSGSARGGPRTGTLRTNWTILADPARCQRQACQTSGKGYIATNRGGER
jgi:hypothetical protein